MRVSLPRLLYGLSLAVLALLPCTTQGWTNSQLVQKNRREQDDEKPKIFFLGPHKTGTESFHNFMNAHGYNSVHDAGYSCQALNLGTIEENFKSGPYNGNGEKTDVPAWVEREELDRFRRHVQEHDVFTDTPWFLLYKLADKEFPGSKFILAIRDTDSWIRSQKRAFGNGTVKPRQWIYGYGSVNGHEDVYREVYEQHARDVLEYFGRDRIGKDLVVFRLGEDSNEDVTEMLNGFLDLDASKGIQLGHDHITPLFSKRMKLTSKE